MDDERAPEAAAPNAVCAEAIALFEAGAYWDTHEVLEPLWLEATGTERHFLAGAILLAAALHKARAMGSARGGRRNYAKALRHLALVPDAYHGVAVRDLEALVHKALRDPTFRPWVPRAEPTLDPAGGVRAAARKEADDA